MNVLELYAGSRSVGKVAERRGHNVWSSDLIDFGGIDYVTDILQFDPSKVPFVPDMIWASPPCTAFSVAAIGKNWDKDTRLPKTDGARLGIQLLEKTLEIIGMYPDALFWMENPRGMMRKMPHVIGMTRHTVTYCQYGDSRMKPTDVWTNSKLWAPRPMCSNGDPCHDAAPRGSSTGTQGVKGAYARSQIPDALCEEIVAICEIEHGC